MFQSCLDNFLYSWVKLVLSRGQRVLLNDPVSLKPANARLNLIFVNKLWHYFITN